MYIEPIKLSPKRNGKGYTSSYSINIAPKEAQICGLIDNRIIKIIDEKNGQITIKAKALCVTDEVLEKIYSLDQARRTEQDIIDKRYFADSKVRTMDELLVEFLDRQSGKIVNQSETELVNFLLSLPCEAVCDLLLLMYLGRDGNCNMAISPGLPRFLDFYDYYGYIVNGYSQIENIDMLLEKNQLSRYLKRGMYLLNLPAGTDWDTICSLHEF